MKLSLDAISSIGGKKSAEGKGGVEDGGTKFGTFGGVFSPTVLTILGVIMYLRLGWVVGNAGLLGAIAIILIAKSITLATSLSMASITTNIKIGAGGAYSIITKSLGLETGGSVGIPFYVSQTLSTALYIIGFTEGWVSLFPDHNYFAVQMSTWAVLITISIISTSFAIKTQYIIMALIAASLFSFFSMDVQPGLSTTMIGNFENSAGFWQVFAVFFPAVTGIMAGANMSGDLKNPRESIPKGTLWAVGLTLIVYIVLTVFMAQNIPTEQLLNNQFVMVETAAFPLIVTIGILAATFSSALGSILGAPRILQALAEHGTVPASKFFAKKSKSNEPMNAMIFTAGFVVIAMMGDLNFLASLITMFFLITYGMLNLVVFIQQSMKIISFRPTIKIPRLVSFYGFAGCTFMMFLIDPVFSAIAIIIITLLYIWLTRRGLEADFGDIRGGMFLVLAERASRIAAKFPRHQVSWKPDLLLPVDNPKVWAGPLLFIRDITHPAGSIFAFTVSPDNRDSNLKALGKLLSPLKNQGIFVNSAVIENDHFIRGSKSVVQTLRGGIFKPNILFLTLGTKKDQEKDDAIEQLVTEASREELGVMILRQHPRVAFGMQKDINLWLRERSTNWHLSVLIALHLQLNWGGRLNLVTTADSEEDVPRMNEFLEKLGEIARLPSLTEYHVIVGGFQETIAAAPKADVNFFGIGETPNFDFMRKTTDQINSSCLFVKDSGIESATV